RLRPGPERRGRDATPTDRDPGRGRSLPPTPGVRPGGLRAPPPSRRPNVPADDGTRPVDRIAPVPRRSPAWPNRRGSPPTARLATPGQGRQRARRRRPTTNAASPVGVSRCAERILVRRGPPPAPGRAPRIRLPDLRGSWLVATPATRGGCRVSRPPAGPRSP